MTELYRPAIHHEKPGTHGFIDALVYNRASLTGRLPTRSPRHHTGSICEQQYFTAPGCGRALFDFVK
jgi:hypothetical protein